MFWVYGQTVVRFLKEELLYYTASFLFCQALKIYLWTFKFSRKMTEAHVEEDNFQKMVKWRIVLKVPEDFVAVKMKNRFIL